LAIYQIWKLKKLRMLGHSWQLLEPIIKFWQFGKKKTIEARQFEPICPWKIHFIGWSRIFQVKIWQSFTSEINHWV
jgi:hypothetical protein